MSVKHTARTACGVRDCCVVTVDPELLPPSGPGYGYSRPMYQVMVDDGSLFFAADGWDADEAVDGGDAMRTTADDYAVPGAIFL